MQPTKVRDAHQKFIEFLKGKKHSSSTILAYGKDIEQLASFLEEIDKHHVSDVSSGDLQAFLAKMSEQGYTPKSLSRKLNSTRTFYRFLKVNEMITDDPSLLVSHPRYELAPPRILKPTEYRALRDAARHDARMFAIIELLLQIIPVFFAGDVAYAVFRAAMAGVLFVVFEIEAVVEEQFGVLGDVAK